MPHFDILVSIVSGAAIVMAAAIVFVFIERQHFDPRLRTVLHGTLFGLATIFAITTATRLENGILIDARGLCLGLAAALVNWPAALIALLFGTIYRIAVGGKTLAVVLGIAGMVTSAIAGMVWRRFVLPKYQATAGSFAILGAMISTRYVFALHALVSIIPSQTIAVTLAWILPVGVFAAIATTAAAGVFIRSQLAASRFDDMSANREGLVDALTGTSNKLGFAQHLATAIAAHSGKISACLLLLAVDPPTPPSDTTDSLIGHTLLSIQRRGDFSARLGPSEFALVLMDAGPAAAMRIAEQIRVDLSAVSSPFSIGISHSPLFDNGELLQSQARMGLYAARLAGGNRVKLWPPYPNEQVEIGA